MSVDKGAGRIEAGQIRKDLEGMSKISDLTVANFLALPDSLKQFLRWIVLKRAVTCAQVAGFLCLSEAEALALLDELGSLGVTERLPICGEPRYWVCLSPRRLRPPFELLGDRTS